MATSKKAAAAATQKAAAEAQAAEQAMQEPTEPEVEQVEIGTTGSFTNDFGVAEEVWGSWTERARDVFNRVHWYMLQNQSIFKHPDAPVVEDAHWKTTTWNAAWIAANATDGR